MIALGSTIGILGGGQLGRMLILAGRAMGYRFHIYEPSGPCPAGQVADLEINASYSDQAAPKHSQKASMLSRSNLKISQPR